MSPVSTSLSSIAVGPQLVEGPDEQVDPAALVGAAHVEQERRVGQAEGPEAHLVHHGERRHVGADALVARGGRRASAPRAPSTPCSAAKASVVVRLWSE